MQEVVEIGLLLRRYHRDVCEKRLVHGERVSSKVLGLLKLGGLFSLEQGDEGVDKANVDLHVELLHEDLEVLVLLHGAVLHDTAHDTQLGKRTVHHWNTTVGILQGMDTLH